MYQASMLLVTNLYYNHFSLILFQIQEIKRIHAFSCKNADCDNLQLSLDGIQESKSSAVTIDAFTITFGTCHKVYPVRFIRPHNKYKYDEQDQIKQVLEDIKLSNCTVTDVILDKPKRSTMKCILGHMATYPCEYCEACAVQIEGISSVAEKIAIKKKYEIRIQNLINTIDFIRESPGSSLAKERDNIKVKELNDFLKKLQKEEQEELRVHSKKRHLCLPSSTMTSTLRTTDLTKYMVSKILRSPVPLDKHETKGIKGQSHLLYLENFRYIDSVPAEYMHTGCLGVVKRLVELTFNVGEKRETHSTRKLSDPELFNEAIKNIQVVREFSRRCRNLDLGVIKAQEYRNYVLFMFPIVIECIEDNYPKEKQIWYYTSFIIRACIIPNDEFDQIKKEDIKKICKKCYTLYEKVHGEKNCTYSFHVILSHILRIRGENPLTSRSAFKYESFYSEMKHLFHPGSSNTLKQILQNTLMKRTFETHYCSKPIKYTEQNNNKKGLENNSLIYIFDKNKQYKFYNIIEINTDGSFQCSEQGRFQYQCPLTPDINWSNVGVFKKGPSSSTLTKIKQCDIHGKFLKINDLLITCPINVLTEQ